MSSTILLDVTDGVATLTLNRPAALNALSFEMMGALAEATSKLAHRDDLRVVVIKGAGEHFMAGFDLPTLGNQLPCKGHFPAVPEHLDSCSIGHGTRVGCLPTQDGA